MAQVSKSSRAISESVEIISGHLGGREAILFQIILPFSFKNIEILKENMIYIGKYYDLLPWRCPRTPRPHARGLREHIRPHARGLREHILVRNHVLVREHVLSRPQAITQTPQRPPVGVRARVSQRVSEFV